MSWSQICFHWQRGKFSTFRYNNLWCHKLILVGKTCELPNSASIKFCEWRSYLTLKHRETHWVRSQHCGYWCPGAKAPGHQYPQYWVNIQFIGPVSYENITLCWTTFGIKLHIEKKLPSRLRVNWPEGDGAVILNCQFSNFYEEWISRAFSWNCPQVKDHRPHWWLLVLNIASGI